MTDFVVAESGIRQLQARYVDAVWRKDYAAFGECFSEDCEWRISAKIIRGRAEAVAFIQSMMVKTRRLLITLRTPILEVGDGVASGRTYFTAQNALTDGTGFTPMGMYYERFAEQDGRWRFTWRLFQTHYSGPPDLTGTFYENPDYGSPPAMPPRDEMTEPSAFAASLKAEAENAKN
jgi:hypothetical protein